MLLVLFVVILALVGGFLGGLLKFAAWLILLSAVIGGVLGFLVYRAFTGLRATR
jgi:positive regulator of sigma E activity